MPTPITEVARLPFAPGSTFEDPSTPTGQIWHEEFLAVLQRQPGYQRLYYGRQIESPNEVLLMIDWDSLDAHKAFMSSTDYDPFVKHLLSILDGDPQLHHAKLSPFPPTRTLSNSSNPVTEVVTFHFPASFSDSDAQDFDKAWAQTLKAFQDNAGPGLTGSGVSGWIVEELEIPNKTPTEKGKAFQLAFGWESVDAHMKFRETQAFKDNIERVREKVAGAWSCHASLKEI
ncbi:MAG: hypothetical protein M4579_001429 [Chaenotheca gracillima]|nr:MAG: hypothetical protein M4579_001429 [Chaenotheca gracillima]